MARWLYLHADYKLRCLDSYRYLSSRYYLEVEILVLNEWRGKKYSVLCFSSSLDDNLPNSRHIKLAIQSFHSKKYIFSNSIAQHFISATFKHRYDELNNQQEFILKSGQNIGGKTVIWWGDLILIRSGEWIHFIDESRWSEAEKFLIKCPFGNWSFDHI